MIWLSAAISAPARGSWSVTLSPSPIVRYQSPASAMALAAS